MHDALAYVPDTEVVDPDDWQDPPVISRTGTDGALTMHVIHEAKRHRRKPNLSATACGRTFHSQFSPLKREELTHRDAEMCPECFHPSEIAEADEERRRELEETR